jgi:hypothetical protein
MKSIENVWRVVDDQKVNFLDADESLSLEQSIAYHTSTDWKFVIDFISDIENLIKLQNF